MSVPSGAAVECTQSTSSALGDVPDYDCTGYGETDSTQCPPPGSDTGYGETDPSDAGSSSDYGSSDYGTSDEGEDGIPDDGCTCESGGSKPGNGNGNGKGNGNGNGKGNGKNGSDSPDAGAGKPEKPNYKCHVGGGKRTCTQPPSCAPGTHPAPCGACVSDDYGSSDCQSPADGGCWVTGGGIVRHGNDKDTFGGNAMGMKDGTIRGNWEHVVHTSKNKVQGKAEYLLCDHVAGPGPGHPSGPKKDFNDNRVRFGGSARWYDAGAWSDGYWFDVETFDRGETGKPVEGYTMTVRKMAGAQQSGAVVYTVTGDLNGGNIQLHPANNGHPSNGGNVPSWVTP